METDNENYDIIIEKTVKDLFRFTDITHIKNIKKAKDLEVTKLEQKLKDLMLEKYSLLINSMNSVQDINLNLSELQNKKDEIFDKMKDNKSINILVNDMTNTKSNIQIWSNEIAKSMEITTSITNDPFIKIWNNIDCLRNSFDSEIFQSTMFLLKELDTTQKDNFNYSIIIVELFNTLIVKMLDVSYNDISINNDELILFEILIELHLLSNNNTSLYLDSEYYRLIHFDSKTNNLYKLFYEEKGNEPSIQNSIRLYIKLKLVRIQKFLCNFDIKNIFYDFFIQIKSLKNLFSQENNDESLKNGFQQQFNYIMKIINEETIKENLLSNNKNLKLYDKIVFYDNLFQDVINYLNLISNEHILYDFIFEIKSTLETLLEKSIISSYKSLFEDVLLKSESINSINETKTFVQKQNLIEMIKFIINKNEHKLWKNIYLQIASFNKVSLNKEDLLFSNKNKIFKFYYKDLRKLSNDNKSKEDLLFDLFISIKEIIDQIIIEEDKKLKSIIENLPSLLYFDNFNTSPTMMDHFNSSALKETIDNIKQSFEFVGLIKNEEKLYNFKKQIFSYLSNAYCLFFDSIDIQASILPEDILNKKIINDLFVIRLLSKKYDYHFLECLNTIIDSLDQSISSKLEKSYIIDLFLNTDINIFSNNDNLSFCLNNNVASLADANKVIHQSIKNYSISKTLTYLHIAPLQIRADGEKKDMSIKFLDYRIDENYHSVNNSNPQQSFNQNKQQQNIQQTQPVNHSQSFNGNKPGYLSSFFPSLS